MRSLFVATFILVAASSVFGCSKQDDALACSTKLSSFKPSASASDKQAFVAACKAVSPKAQACLAAVKAEAEMDSCISDKAEKEAFFAAAMAASSGKDRRAAKSGK